jgi:hypothetical protein
MSRNPNEESWNPIRGDRPGLPSLGSLNLIGYFWTWVDLGIGLLPGERTPPIQGLLAVFLTIPLHFYPILGSGELT